MVKEGKICFSTNTVNNEVEWSLIKKSQFIHSLLIDFPLSPIYAKIDDSKEVFLLLDEVEKIKSLLSFLEDEFVISKDIPDVNGIVIAGLKFSELPEQVQSSILSKIFKIVHIDSSKSEEFK